MRTPFRFELNVWRWDVIILWLGFAIKGGHTRMNEKLKKIRAYPKDKSIKTDLMISFGAILLGAFLGFIAKATDSVSIIGDIGTDLGVWVFIATIVAVYSRYPFTAAINTMLFFLAMLGAYYIYGHLVLDFFPKSYFMGWLAVALLSPVAGFMVWFSKGTGFIGIIISALPISVLFASGYTAFYTHNPVSFLALVFGMLLTILLPCGLRQRLLSFCMAILLAFIINIFHLLSWLPF